MTRPSVFAYLDYRAYLEDWLSAQKLVDPSYSYAVFAREAGCSKGTLANVIRGARAPRTESLDAFARAMDLTPTERNYLGLLVELATSNDLEARHAVMERILSSERYRQVRYAEGDSESDRSRYFETWYVPVIRELVGLPGFRDDPEWIARTLRPPIRAEQAAAGLATLLELGFVSRTESGAYERREVRFRTQATSRTISGFLRVYTEVIPDRLRQLDPTQSAHQHVLSGILSLPVALMPEFKKRLDELVEQLGNLADDPGIGGPKRVYLLAAQLLPMTDTVGTE